MTPPKDKPKAEVERKVKGINYLIRLPKDLAIEMQEELHALRIEEIQTSGRGKSSIAAFWREAAVAHIMSLRTRRLAK